MLSEHSREFHNASHHCWGFRVGDPLNPLERYADAGEPTGTAGKPIFDQLCRLEVVHVILIVSRWFGGTKLGRGGLIRSYSECAELTLSNLKIQEIVIMSTIKLNCAYNMVGLIEKLVAQFEGKIIGSQFQDKVEFQIKVPQGKQQVFADSLIDSSAGQIEITELM